MKTVKLKVLCILLISGFLAIQTQAQRADQAYLIETFDLIQPELLDIRTSGGFIRVLGTESDEVRVEMYARQNNRYLDETDTALDEFDIKIEKDGNRVIAHAIRESQRGWRSWGGSNITISFIVYSPRNSNVEARTSGGSITADNLSGELNLRTSGGSISLARLSGVVEARTSGGSISIEDVEGNLDARTSGGSITASTSIGNLNLRTSGGSIRLDQISGTVDARTSGGSIQAKMDQVGDHLDLRTSGGSINIEVPREFGYELDLRGSRVRSDLNDFSGSVERNRITGTILEGGPAIRAQTSGGTVSIRYS